ncbi:hypothetical protein BKA62DRAFT_695960 [Auriculariales sp. MPI-PUGE-AT-0066]|nr:hypothetical protein BKA62DRAFT_695960 [Auriculariales sp. MPI-PUGE-AT-0066]
MGGLGTVLEPLVVVSLLAGGTWWNRDRSLYPAYHKIRVAVSSSSRSGTPDSAEHLLGTYSDEVPTRRIRNVQFLGWKHELSTPNTQVHEHRLVSRVIKRYPFLAEVWYWALIYWVSVALCGGRVHVMQKLIGELHPGAVRSDHRFPTAMMWINWLYSFIHIPGTIFFLIYLYWFCISRNRITHLPEEFVGQIAQSHASPLIFEARRRTMAMCNLLAFIVFTLWPCMPPRLLSDPNVPGDEGELARSFGFVDTVHGKDGASSVWTQNRFCNQYAAMPSLHFGYSLMIGLTIGSLLSRRPIVAAHCIFRSLVACRLPSSRRALCLAVGFTYPAMILLAIVSTANHFVLDAVAGACVCGESWLYGNGFLLNLLPLEDYFLSLIRVHKPQYPVVDLSDHQA